MCITTLEFCYKYRHLLPYNLTLKEANKLLIRILTYSYFTNLENESSTYDERQILDAIVKYTFRLYTLRLLDELLNELDSLTDITL